MTMSLLQLAARLVVDEENLRLSLEASLAETAALLCDTAKDSLGEYQPGWPALQPATISRKTTGDSPLLETGELRDSIKWNADKREAYVGTDNPKGEWHEFGTATIPPRPFLGAALTGPAIQKIVHRNVGRAMGGHGNELAQALHAAHLIAHKAKETAKEIFDDDNTRYARR